jgi:hypothetical protein
MIQFTLAAALAIGTIAAPQPPQPPKKPITERSRDVNLPPPLPPQGRPQPSRVSFDDPTAELGHAAITGPAIKVALAPAPFLRAVIPDPFEFGVQVRPNIPRALEPAPAPVPVDPKRPK